MKSFPAFLFTSCWIILFLVGWMFMVRLLRQWTGNGDGVKAAGKKLGVVLGAELLVFMCTFLVIGYGIKAEHARIEMEKNAVEAVLATAEQPVYASDVEELYHRYYPGFQYHVFSDMELARDAKGTILLNHDEEGYQIIATGGKFTELSPYTGLFTYDQSVVDKLTEMGYTFTGYYSAERQVNLKDLKRANKLEMSEQGELILRGKEHSLKSGPDIEQFGGSYTATFRIKQGGLRLEGENLEQPVCILRVCALYGEDVRAERIVYGNELQETESMEISLDYGIGNTVGIQFQVECEDGTEVLIEGISWRRNP